MRLKKMQQQRKNSLAFNIVFIGSTRKYGASLGFTTPRRSFFIWTSLLLLRAHLVTLELPSRPSLPLCYYKGNKTHDKRGDTQTAFRLPAKLQHMTVLFFTVFIWDSLNTEIHFRMFCNNTKDDQRI